MNNLVISYYNRYYKTITYRKDVYGTPYEDIIDADKLEDALRFNKEEADTILTLDPATDPEVEQGVVLSEIESGK